MTDRPILFTCEMVRAILGDRKTQTRRLMREPWMVRLLKNMNGDYPIGHTTKALAGLYAAQHNNYGAVSVVAQNGKLLGLKPDEFEWASPFGRVGDRLWVRETWAIVENDKGADCVQYRANIPEVDWKLYGPFRPSIFMPRRLSRLTLEITGVRVERLQDVSEADIAAEGIFAPTFAIRDRWTVFSELWDGINGKRASWASDPFVWVIEFKRVTA